MGTRKVRINDGSATPLEIPEQAGKLHVKTSAGVVPLTELWAKDPVDSTAKLIWKPVPSVDVPTQIDTQGTVNPGDPCVGAVCASGGLVEYPVIPGLGTRWDCSVWSNTGNCARGPLVTNGTFSWSWHTGNDPQLIAKIYEVDGTYSPPPPGHIILDYGTDNISSQITMFLKSHSAVNDGSVTVGSIIMSTGAGIHADCNGSMPVFPGASGTAGYAFTNSNGSGSAIPYVYICGLGGGQGAFGCDPSTCSQSNWGTGGIINPNQSICECSGDTIPCISTCCNNPPGNEPPCGQYLVVDCGPQTGVCLPGGGSGSTDVVDLITSGLVVPLIDTGCVRTNTACSTICYSVPAVQTPVLFGSTGTPPLLKCRSVCRVPNVVYTASDIAFQEGLCASFDAISPTCMYNSGHKFSDFGMVMNGGCNCAECPQQTSCATQGCAGQFSMRIIMPFYFNFPNTMFNNTGVDLRGRIIDIIHSGLFLAYPGYSGGGNGGYEPGNTERTLPVILSGIRDLLVGRISSCCSVMAPVYQSLAGTANEDLIPVAGDPNIFWCMNEFPRQNGLIPSHTHQLVIELNLGNAEICPQCFFPTPTGPDYEYNIDAFQFYPITDRFGTILEPLGSFLSKQLAGVPNTGVSAIKSLRFMAHTGEGIGNYGNLYSNTATTFTYTNRAENGDIWEGVYLEVPRFGNSVRSYIATKYTTDLFQPNTVGGNNTNILNKLLNVIQQPQYPISTPTTCSCAVVP